MDKSKVILMVAFGFLALFLLSGSTLAEKEKGLKDKDIALAVESELLIDESAPSHLIDVSNSVINNIDVKAKEARKGEQKGS